MKTFANNLRVMFQYSWRVSKRIFFSTSIQILLDTVEPLLMIILPKFIIDELSIGKNWSAVVQYIILFISAMLFIKVARMLLDVFINSTYNRIQSRTGQEYFNDFLTMDYEHLEDSNFRDLSAKIKYNVRCANFIGTDVAEFITKSILFIGFSFIILFNGNIVLWLVIILTTILEFFISEKQEKYHYQMQKPLAKFGRKFEYIYSTLVDVTQAKDLRINRLYNLLISKYDDQIKEYTDVLKATRKTENRFSMVRTVNIFIRDVVLYMYAAYSFIKSWTALGDFTMFVGSVINASNSLLSLIRKINHFRVFCNDIQDYSFYKKNVVPRHLLQEAVKIDVVSYTLSLQGVYFKYPKTKEYILRNINLTIRPQEKLGIVGLNGAGKSTLVKLICRLYKPDKGRIFLNGVDIYSIDYNQYRSILTAIFQDYQLFAFSIYDNIVLGNTYCENRFKAAIANAGMSDVLEHIGPKKEHTMITKNFDEDGVDLSGGERQKLALARAFYKDAPIIIMDEPTSAMDPIAEYEFYQRFDNLSKHKMVIYISHRLSATKFCDKIAVIDKGSIVEIGTHNELLEKQGIYEKLFRSQASLYTHKKERNSE